MLAPQNRRRIARLVVVSSDSEDDVTHNKSDNDNYEPSPLKKRKWVHLHWCDYFIYRTEYFFYSFICLHSQNFEKKRRASQEDTEEN